jgi:outer membrane protein assembly factor BamB
MLLRKNFFLFTSLCFSIGCASFDLTSNVAREFQIEKKWIRSALEKPNLFYRKINRMTPLITDQFVVSGNSIDGLSAWNRETGQKIWRQPVINGVEGGAAIVKDKIFFGASDGHVYSIGLKTGKIDWSVNVRSEVLSEPLIDTNEGIIFALTSANTLHALDATNGRVVWIYTRQEAATLSIRGGSRPTLKNGVLYAGFGDGYLAALNAKNGQLMWEVLLNKNKRYKDIETTPLIDDDKLYVAGFDDRLLCLSLDKGEILWRKDVGGYGALTISGQRLFYPTSTGTLYALDKNTGQELWGYKLTSGIGTSAIPYKGLVAIGESLGDLLFLDAAKGTLVGRFEPGRGVFSAPAVDEKNNEVYFISNDSNLYSLKAAWKNKNAFSWLTPKGEEKR